MSGQAEQKAEDPPIFTDDGEELWHTSQLVKRTGKTQKGIWHVLHVLTPYATVGQSHLYRKGEVLERIRTMGPHIAGFVSAKKIADRVPCHGDAIVRHLDKIPPPVYEKRYENDHGRDRIYRAWLESDVDEIVETMREVMNG